MVWPLSTSAWSQRHGDYLGIDFCGTAQSREPQAGLHSSNLRAQRVRARYYFHTDGSGTDWGWKFTVTPFLPPAAEDPHEALAATLDVLDMREVHHLGKVLQDAWATMEGESGDGFAEKWMQVRADALEAAGFPAYFR